MSKPKVGPEAKIINAFLLLPEDSKRIVLDVIKSQSVAPRKAPAKKAAASAPALKEATTDKEAKCGVCGNVQDHADHDRRYLKSHDFVGPKSVARVTRKSKQKEAHTLSVPNTEGAMGSAMAASSSSD